MLGLKLLLLSLVTYVSGQEATYSGASNVRFQNRQTQRIRPQSLNQSNSSQYQPPNDPELSPTYKSQPSFQPANLSEYAKPTPPQEEIFSPQQPIYSPPPKLPRLNNNNRPLKPRNWSSKPEAKTPSPIISESSRSIEVTPLPPRLRYVAKDIVEELPESADRAFEGPSVVRQYETESSENTPITDEEESRLPDLDEVKPLTSELDQNPALDILNPIGLPPPYYELDIKESSSENRSVNAYEQALVQDLPPPTPLFAPVEPSTSISPPLVYATIPTSSFTANVPPGIPLEYLQAPVPSSTTPPAIKYPYQPTLVPSSSPVPPPAIKYPYQPTSVPSSSPVPPPAIEYPYQPTAVPSSSPVPPPAIKYPNQQTPLQSSSTITPTNKYAYKPTPEPIAAPTSYISTPVEQPAPIYSTPQLQPKPSYPPQTMLTPEALLLNNFQCNRGSGYYSITNQCDAYVKCQNQKAWQHSCPDGLHFNPKAIFPEYPCAYPSEVKCEATSVKQLAKPTEQCPRQYGFFSTPEGDCSQYLMCQEGLAILMNCPFGLVFNDRLSSCDWPENAPQCNPDAFKDLTCPTPPAGDEDYLFKYRYGDDCKLYVACQRGYPRLLRCDSGLSFDEDSQVCIDSDYVRDCGARI